ncbi:DUF4124 domain-containing protein [Stenotrophomonas sp. NLF4-10]|uniref:DUF4124 domain-containing protein n=1 Tax=Stenotrophomonas sp. NLF4-10 TaxID=2918754 RepID=UPI001EFA7568|nr:DUF4124 domain-containing protein [Stenotrophomonas sp. NLF4-10]MCG8276293.1 DUF4124 domain-containing protein [Stenotrophomonas sp. NLF4-10]
MNRRLPILAFAMLMLLPGLAAAQVYKCKGKSGETVYSEFPCDASAQPMKLRDDPVAAAAAPVADGTGTPAPQESNVSAPTTGEVDRSAERECVANATASIYGPSNDRVAAHQQQMAMLNEQLAGADAQRSQALRARMATLRQAITREHANANTLVNAARRRCIEQYRTTP